MKKLAILSLVLVLVVAGCQVTDNSTTDDLTGKIVLNDDDFVFIDDNVDTQDDNETSDDTTIPTVDENRAKDVAYTLTVTEGDLVSLDLEAVDPDGDSIDYVFDEPLNEKGRWQTSIGDEGRYLTAITASDGKLSTTEDLLIIVERANRPPVIECPETFKVKEGEKLLIDCNIYDEEGDNILISYEGWSTSSSKITGFDDAGEYTELIRANDGNGESTKKIAIIVENMNRVPEIESIDDMTVMETTKIEIVPRISDPDGDDLTVSFSSPLSDDGVWRTQDGDAGKYTVNVAVSDGTATATTSFDITVTQINTAPVLKAIDDIEVDEGDTIKIKVNAYDPEGDELIVSYSGFMDAAEYTTSYDESGSYEQSVTVSDGVLETTQSFTITVNDKNRPPRFIIPGA